MHIFGQECPNVAPEASKYGPDNLNMCNIYLSLVCEPEIVSNFNNVFPNNKKLKILHREVEILDVSDELVSKIAMV